jgi:hypothetical protein
MMYEKGTTLYQVCPSNEISKHVVIAHDTVRGIIRTENGAIRDENVFVRRENAIHAAALMQAIDELKEKDWKQHLTDIEEGIAFKKQQESRKIAVVDVVIERMVGEPTTMTRDGVVALGAVAGKGINQYGVLDLGAVKIVPSESRGDVYYPVSRDKCGCPSFFFRHGGKTGRCKHMEEYFPEE